jgi:hypothetical protein
MKKILVSIFALAVIGIFAFNNADNGAISGKVTPADGASQVWAFQGTDTLNAPISDGAFNVKDVKAGTYTVIVGAKSPFKDVTVTNVKVQDDKTTDLGEIKLSE